MERFEKDFRKRFAYSMHRHAVLHGGGLCWSGLGDGVSWRCYHLKPPAPSTHTANLQQPSSSYYST
ncbi:hypothetical protein J6590_065523 [Homalodisca vitripennis]|nr:hypothetical protein J6590_065523 [Homalodisca vitripennis]